MGTKRSLTDAKIVAAAMSLADRRGLQAVSMRQVATELGVEAMSLYHHVKNKDDLLDRLINAVIQEIGLPKPTDSWREAMRARAKSARAVLSQHSWALGMLESRPSPGPALLHHHDRVLGCLLSNGFSAQLATHAFSTIDAYVYGFVLTEASLPFNPGEGAEEDFATEVAPSVELYPFLNRALEELFAQGSFRLTDEFDVGLELILEALEQRLGDNRP